MEFRLLMSTSLANEHRLRSISLQLRRNTTYRDNDNVYITQRLLTEERMRARWHGVGFQRRYFRVGPRYDPAGGQRLQSPGLRFPERWKRRQQHVRLPRSVRRILDCAFGRWVSNSQCWPNRRIPSG